MRFDCRDRLPGVRLRALALATAIVLSTAMVPAAMMAQEAHGAAAASETEAPHGQTVVQMIAKIVNFAMKPTVPGMPASESMKSVISAARPGRRCAWPEKDSRRPQSWPFCASATTTPKAPRFMNRYANR